MFSDTADLGGSSSIGHRFSEDVCYVYTRQKRGTLAGGTCVCFLLNNTNCSEAEWALQSKLKQARHKLQRVILFIFNNVLFLTLQVSYFGYV